jgi:hypothetical protein
MTGTNDQRAVGGQFPFTTANGFFDQLRGADVGVHGVVGLRHEGPRRPLAESSERCVVQGQLHYTVKKSREYARKANGLAASDPILPR